MTLLPVVERELRVASRRPVTHWARIVAAGIAFGIMAVMLVSQSGRQTAVWIANAIFQTLAYGAFGIASISGVFLTADCLSEEKREGTLGLLFLTDLKSWDVVLGKLASTSLLGVYCLLAILPMLAVPVLFGGITLGQFLRVCLALLTIMGLSLGVGVGVSAIGRQTRAVTSATLFIMLGLAGGLVLPVQALGHWFPMSPAARWLDAFSPFSLIRAALNPIFGSSALLAPAYLVSLTAHLAMVAGAFLTACVLLPHRWQERAVRPSGKGSALGLSDAARRLASRWLLDRNPFYWLALRTSGTDRWASMLLLGLAIVFLGLYFIGLDRGNSGYFAAAVFSSYGIHVIVKSLMALSAVRRLCEDRTSGALELMLVTPLSPQAIVAGQREALQTQWRRTVVGLCLMNALMLLAVWYSEHFHGKESFIFTQFFAGGVFLLFADVHALGYIGMSMALKHSKPQRAALAAIGQLLLPGFAGIFLIVLIIMASRGGNDELVSFCHTCWFLGSIGTALGFGNRARITLERDLRALTSGDMSAARASRWTERLEVVSSTPSPAHRERPPSLVS